MAPTEEAGLVWDASTLELPAATTAGMPNRVRVSTALLIVCVKPAPRERETTTILLGFTCRKKDGLRIRLNDLTGEMRTK